MGVSSYDVIARPMNCDFLLVNLYRKCWPVTYYLSSGVKTAPAILLNDDVPWILTLHIY